MAECWISCSVTSADSMSQSTLPVLNLERYEQGSQERLAFLAHLVVALGLEQHARVRAGKADDGERTNQGRGHKSIGVVQRQRNFSNPAVIIPCDKQYVIALA